MRDSPKLFFCFRNISGSSQISSVVLIFTGSPGSNNYSFKISPCCWLCYLHVWADALQLLLELKGGNPAWRTSVHPVSSPCFTRPLTSSLFCPQVMGPSSTSLTANLLFCWGPGDCKRRLQLSQCNWLRRKGEARALWRIIG